MGFWFASYFWERFPKVTHPPYLPLAQVGCVVSNTLWKQFYILYWWFEPSESLWIWKFWNSNQTHYMFSLWLHIWMQAFSSDAVPSRDQNLHPPKWLVTPFFPIPFMSYTFSYLLSFGEKWFPFILTLVFYLKKRTIFFFFLGLSFPSGSLRSWTSEHFCFSLDPEPSRSAISTLPIAPLCEMIHSVSGACWYFPFYENKVKGFQCSLCYLHVYQRKNCLNYLTS